VNRLRSPPSPNYTFDQSVGGASRQSTHYRRHSAHLQPRNWRQGFYAMELDVDRDLRSLVNEHPEGAFGILSEDAHLS